MGVLGDSYSAQYGGGDLGGHGARNWVEILSATHRVSFGRPGGPRTPASYNPDFPYDWAFVTANSTQVLDEQLPPLLSEVISGRVRYVSIFFGINDIGQVVESAVLDPGTTRADLQQESARVLKTTTDNLDQIIMKLFQANPNIKIVLATIPDVRDLPMFAPVFRQPYGQILGETVASMQQAYNTHIHMLGTLLPSVAVADVASTFQEELGSSPPDPSLFTPDGMHPTTVPQGWIANDVLDALRSKFHVPAPAVPARLIALYSTIAQKRQAAGRPLP